MTDLRILIVSGTFPHVAASREAANVVSFEITRELAKTRRFQVSYLCVNSAAPERPIEAAADFLALEELGVRFVGAVTGDPPLNRQSAFLTALFRPVEWLPGSHAADAVAALVDRLEIDVVLSIWTEYGTAACNKVAVPVLAYYGNPDFKSVFAGAWFEWKYGRGRLYPRQLWSFFKELIISRLRERAHLIVMRRLAFVAEVAANDAAYYAARRVKAAYVNNMWPAAIRQDWEAMRDRLEVATPVKIVGNVGNLSATGNTFGIHTIATAIIPELKRLLGPNGFEIHLFGARNPHRYLRPLLADPSIRVRGFVDDIDSEMLSAPIFLVANNHGVFKVGHTRFLHAWSLGACVVGFDESREAMPEIVHEKNALLGSTPGEVARLVVRAAEDVKLRRGLGRRGIETLLERFNPGSVCSALAEQLTAAGGRSR
jgi:hypothetical protein